MTSSGRHTGPRRLFRTRLAWLALALALLVGACASPIGVRRVGFAPVFTERSANVLATGELSVASKHALSALGLLDELRVDPEGVRDKLLRTALVEKRRLYFGLLAELQYAHSHRSEDRAGFLIAAFFAYSFLFDGELSPEPNPFDPLYRLACDIYNRALARALLDDAGFVRVQDGQFTTSAGRFDVVASRPGFEWGEDEFRRFLPSDAFLVRGLRERIRIPGLGVPLIAIREKPKIAGAREVDHVGAQLKLPATVVIEFEGGTAAMASGQIRANLKLYHSGECDKVTLGGHEVPLEVDLTAPLAYTLEESDVWEFSLKGFFGQSGLEPASVNLLQPHHTGKIPVVLVHGTASNPAVWAQLVNGLALDRELRRSYEVWIARYDTGTPILFNAAEVRKALTRLVQELDPHGEDPALKRMVIVGHSQGGLITRLLVSSSGDHFWNSISDSPPEQFLASDTQREFARRCFFFEPLPFVERAVFIATPHKGSFLADSWLGSIAQRLINLPGQVINVSTDLFRAEKIPMALREGIPTSVNNMEPGSPFVRNLQKAAFAPGVALHSIVAVKGDGPVEDGDDGVVRYKSAHVEGVESEFIIRHGHSCQNEPSTVLELRRILLEHAMPAASPGAAGPR